jgi:hypothetical protein
MRRAIAREEQDLRVQDRFASTVVIAALIDQIIAALGLHVMTSIGRHREFNL